MEHSEISYSLEILFKEADTTITISTFLDMRIFFKYMVKKTSFEESLRKLILHCKLLEDIGRLILFECNKKSCWMKIGKNKDNEILWKEKCLQNVMLVFGYKMTGDYFEYPPFHAVPTHKIESILLELALMRAEIRLLLADKHPHQDFLMESIREWITDANNDIHCQCYNECFVCNEVDNEVSLCMQCDNNRFCKECLYLFHRHPDRANHSTLHGKKSFGPKSKMLSCVEKIPATKFKASCSPCSSLGNKEKVFCALRPYPSDKLNAFPEIPFEAKFESMREHPTTVRSEFSNHTENKDGIERYFLTLKNQNDHVPSREQNVRENVYKTLTNDKQKIFKKEKNTEGENLADQLVEKIQCLDYLFGNKLSFLDIAVIASSDLTIDENVYEDYLRLRDNKKTSLNYIYYLRKDARNEYIYNKLSEIGFVLPENEYASTDNAENSIEEYAYTMNHRKMQVCYDSIWQYSQLNGDEFSAENDLYLLNTINNVRLTLEQKAISLHCEFGLSFENWKNFLLAYEVLQEKPELDINAVKECISQNNNFDNISLYLNHSCKSCRGVFPAAKMIKMVVCNCEICEECFITGYSIKIQEMSCTLEGFQCLLCDQPKNLTDGPSDEASTLHWQLLTNLFKQYIPNLVGKFSERLACLSLLQNDQFMWCQHCANGFFIDDDSTCLDVQCDQCKNKSCSRCKCKWEDQHEDLSCEEFLEWKISNDPNYQEQRLAKYLELHGIVCPRCKRKFELAKGGCMHFTCPCCKCEFCCGCKQLMFKGACDKPSCSLSPGLHAHHPRNCLYYLRDLSAAQLQNLLKENHIEYEAQLKQFFSNVSPDVERICRVMIQKPTRIGLRDEICGKAAFSECLCEFHYKEYLTMLINRAQIDPVTIYDENQLKQILKREGISHCLESKQDLINLIKAEIKLTN